MAKRIVKQPKPEKIPLSKEAIDEKKSNLNRLVSLRKEVMGRLIVAREMGDLSENGAYTAAKHELGSIGRQLRQIRYVLANAYTPKVLKADIAGFGKTITLKNDKTSLTFILVGQYESDVDENKYSLESPIGRAVVGKMVGDKITIVSPKGKSEYTINLIK
jgi:transcription elongation factor GreA